jgi:hypothetical protein
MWRTGLGIGASLIGMAAAAAAHPGHGLAGGSQSWLHYASDPFHVAPLVLVALALLWRRRSRARASTR